MNETAEQALTYVLERKRATLAELRSRIAMFEDDLTLQRQEEDMLKREVEDLEDELGVTEAVPA